MKKLAKSSALLFLTLGLGACGGGGGSSSPAETPVSEGGSPAETPAPDTSENKVFQSAVSTPELDYSSAPVYWDLETNSIVTEDDDWELKISRQGYGHVIQVNGGASGSGDAAIGAVMADSPFEVTDPTDRNQVYKFFEDTASGVLSTPGGYGPLEYSVAGMHKMWPNYATYVFEENGAYYKAQVIGNYGEDGTSPSATLQLRIAQAGANEPSQIVTLDAASDTTKAAYLDLATGVTVSEDQIWHLAYQKYVGFKTNSGVSGNGNVQGCLAHSYETLYDENGSAVQTEFESKTAENTLATFDAVTYENCSESDWLTDAVQSQFKDWYTYDMATHTVTIHEDASNGWILRSASSNTEGDYQYARIKVTDFGSGKLTFAVENWAEQE